MNNPLKTPENQRAIKELGQLSRQPLRTQKDWLRMILGERAFSSLSELQDEAKQRFVADKIHHFKPHGQHD